MNSIKCPKCGSTECFDIYSAPNCEEGPVTLRCTVCGTVFEAEDEKQYIIVRFPAYFRDIVTKIFGKPANDEMLEAYIFSLAAVGARTIMSRR